MKKMISITIALISVFILLHSCTPTEPQIEKNITIQEYDVAVMEAYIHLSFESKQKRNLQLYRDNKFIYNFMCNKKDTIIVDTTLMESTSYNYSIKEINSSTIVAESNKINVITLKPTSHNYTWETFTFGEYNSSRISDVAIIDDNDIWGVGEIYMNDTLGQPDPIANGFVKWDGNSWKIFKMEATAKNGNITKVKPTGIFASSKNNIWFTHGSVFHWDGIELNFSLERYDFFNAGNETVFKIWGSSKTNIYGVGTEGAVIYFNGSTWQQIDSGTKTTIIDVLGFTNAVSGSNEVYCAVSSSFIEPGRNDRKILRIIKNDIVEEITWGPQRLLFTVWTNKGYPIYAGGDGLYENKKGSWKKIELDFNFIKTRIRGTALNNIFVIGGGGLLAHYNGKSWKLFNDLSIRNKNFSSISINKNGLIVIGGYSGSKAIITIGKPN